MQEVHFNDVERVESFEDERLSDELMIEIMASMEDNLQKINAGADERKVDFHANILAIIDQPKYSELKHLHVSVHCYLFPNKEMSRLASSYLGFALKSCAKFEQISFYDIDFRYGSHDSLFYEFSNRSQVNKISFYNCVVDSIFMNDICRVLQSPYSEIRSASFSKMEMGAELYTHELGAFMNRHQIVPLMATDGTITLKKDGWKTSDDQYQSSNPQDGVPNSNNDDRNNNTALHDSFFLIGNESLTGIDYTPLHDPAIAVDQDGWQVFEATSPVQTRNVDRRTDSNRASAPNFFSTRREDGPDVKSINAPSNSHIASASPPSSPALSNSLKSANLYPQSREEADLAIALALSRGESPPKTQADADLEFALALSRGESQPQLSAESTSATVAPQEETADINDVLADKIFGAGF